MIVSPFVDKSFLVRQVTKARAPARRVLLTTMREIERVGTLKFFLKGQQLRLTAFLEVEEPRANRLFVPFSDLTSGAETYQAGRYMELDPTATGIYVVDFNVAYNPYCYYSPEYDCPLPPRENRLEVPIRAGEKMQQADSSIP